MDVDHVDHAGILSGAGRVVGLVDGQGQAGELDRLLHGEGVAYHHRAARGIDLRVGQGFDHHLRPDAAGVSHGDGNGRFFIF